MDDQKLSHISGLKNLRALSLSSSATITDLGVGYISNLDLTTLSLGICNQIGNAGISFLSRVITLTDLSLKQCKAITYHGYAALSVLTNLKTLRLEDCGESNLEFLRNFTFLEAVDLSKCMFLKKKEILPVTLCLSNLLELNLSGCRKLKNEAIEKILHLTKLRALNLAQCTKITTSGILRCTALQNLRYLDFTDCKNVKGSSVKNAFNGGNMYITLRYGKNE